MRELNNEEQNVVNEILKQLAGFNIEQAETIINQIKADLRERAVIE